MLNKCALTSGGGIREYFVGPPGPPGPPGAPGTPGHAVDGLVNDVASRVMAYIHSMVNHMIMLHRMVHKTCE